MEPLYGKLCVRFGWAVDEALRARLCSENDAALAVFDAAIAGATERDGPVEVGAAMIKKAQFLSSIGDVQGTIKAYKGLPEKSLSTGGKADVAMAAARLCMAHSEWECVAPRAVTLPPPYTHPPRFAASWRPPYPPPYPPSPPPASQRKRWPKQRR